MSDDDEPPDDDESTEHDPPLAPGRYCLAICYCRQCPHWQPMPPIRNWPDPNRDRRERW